MAEPTEPKPDEPERNRPERDEEWVAKRFPAAGPPPSNVIVVDPDLPPAPNITHPA